MSTGAILFMTVSWVFVLGLTFWAFSRILSIQKHRTATPDPADDMTARDRVPPTA